MLRLMSLILLALMTEKGFAQNKRAGNFFRNKTKIANPLNLRDPFKPPFSKANTSKSSRGFRVTGVSEYSNIGEVAYSKISIETLKIVGVLIGKERRALANAGDGRIIILKEGMKIGQDNAELKAILPGGIVLVEKMINVYGEEEFLETVIPISK